MLLNSGENIGTFDPYSKFIYDEDYSNELYNQLLENQEKLKKFALENGLEEKYQDNLNIFKKRAELYDPYASNEDDEIETNKYYYVCNLLYNYNPTDVFGRPKPFDFEKEFARVSSFFGKSRALTGKVTVTPYFVPTPPEKISLALNLLAYRLDFEWNQDNPLTKISKIIPFLTAVQPLIDGNHKSSHAIIQYFLGQTGLPGILGKKGLKEHNECYTNAERRAIVEDDINDLIMYYFYNILERQKEICQILGADPKEIITGSDLLLEDEMLQ